MQMHMSHRLCRRSSDSSTRKNFPLFSQQSVTGYEYLLVAISFDQFVLLAGVESVSWLFERVRVSDCGIQLTFLFWWDLGQERGRKKGGWVDGV